nr:hypothetical protein [Tanacetum cinerariifolium]
METKDTLSSCSNSEAQQMQQTQDKAKKSCMVSFRQLRSHLKLLSNKDLNGTRTESGFNCAFARLFGQDVETFIATMFLNVDQLEKQLAKEEFQEIGSMASLKSINERAQHKQEYDSWLNERQMQTVEEKVDTSKALDASLVDKESSGTESKEQDTSSIFENDAHADDVDIRPIYDKEPMDEVQTTADINVFAIGQHHTEQLKFNNEGEVDHNVEQCHDTWKPVLQPHRNRSVVRKPTAFKSERPRISKPQFSSQVDVNNDLSKPVTTHYLSKEREVSSAKPNHVIASRNSRNSSKNMQRFSSNDMKCVFNANHDHCVTKFLNEVNSRAKIPSNMTMNKNKLVEQISVHKKPERQILTRHRFSIKKTFVVHEKTTSPRSYLGWKQMSRIFKTAGLRWVPTRKIFAFSTKNVDSKPTIGSDDDITNQHECKQTLDVSAGTLNLNAASLGNTSFDFSKDLSKDLLASLAISPFHDSPYMKVMQAYNATGNETPILPQAPIAPPTILPSSIVLPLSSIFDPRDFFPPEEIFSPRKRARFLSSSSNDFSAPPHVFETRESSHKMHLERQEE